MVLYSLLMKWLLDLKPSFQEQLLNMELFQTWQLGVKELQTDFHFCALTGKKEIMELGGINREGEEKVFLISTTHGGETHGLTAAIATIDEYKNKNVIAHTHAIGKKLIDLCSQLIKRK